MQITGDKDEPNIDDKAIFKVLMSVHNRIVRSRCRMFSKQENPFSLNILVSMGKYVRTKLKFQV